MHKQSGSQCMYMGQVELVKFFHQQLTLLDEMVARARRTHPTLVAAGACDANRRRRLIEDRGGPEGATEEELIDIILCDENFLSIRLLHPLLHLILPRRSDYPKITPKLMSWLAARVSGGMESFIGLLRGLSLNHYYFWSHVDPMKLRGGNFDYAAKLVTMVLTNRPTWLKEMSLEQAEYFLTVRSACVDDALEKAVTSNHGWLERLDFRILDLILQGHPKTNTALFSKITEDVRKNAFKYLNWRGLKVHYPKELAALWREAKTSIFESRPPANIVIPRFSRSHPMFEAGEIVFNFVPDRTIGEQLDTFFQREDVVRDTFSLIAPVKGDEDKSRKLLKFLIAEEVHARLSQHLDDKHEAGVDGPASKKPRM